MTLGLRGRLVGAVIALLVALFAVCATLVVVRSEDALARVQAARFRATTEQLAGTIGYAVLARSPTLLEPSLSAFAGAPELVAVTVLDDEGGTIARVTRPASGATVTIEAAVVTRAAPPGDDEGELVALGAGGGEARPVGRVVAIFSTAASERLRKNLRRDILAAVALVGGAGVLGVLLLASTVVRRVRRLAGAASRVASGELTTRVEDEGGDELAALARDFNAMTASLERAARELADKESLAAIGRATAVIAHELKNPLGILLGAAEIVGDEAKPEEMRRRAAGIITGEIARLERTLASLLDYARPRAPERAAVELIELARAVAERAALPGGPAEGLAVTAGGEAVTALVDRAQAEQILWNLVANAAQAGARTIAMTVRAAGARARVDVVDDGPGVDPGLADRIFRPFVTSKQRGAGLGLAASRRMARDNGGELALEPSQAGAHFALELERP